MANLTVVYVPMADQTQVMQSGLSQVEEIKFWTSIL